METRAPALIAAAALSVAAAPPQRAERVIVVDGAGDLVAIAPNGARERLTRHPARDFAPALSPDGGRLAFTSDRAGDLGVYVLEPATGHVERVAAGSEPAWAPDGRLAYAAGDGVRVGDKLVAPQGREPAWAPDGRLAVVLPDGVYVEGTLVAAGGRSPAWAPDGRLAYVVGADVHVDGRLVVTGALAPSWSPDGTQLVFVRDGDLWTAAADGSDARPLTGALPLDSDPAWGLVALPPAPKPRPRPDPNELLPDLDQRAPRGLTIMVARGRFLLGFTSATDNVGRGPAWFRGVRPNGRTPRMRADQLIRLRNGRMRVVRGVGVMRYTWSSSHSHWHLLGFQRFELRRAADFSLVVRDRKTGFCLADHYGLARHRVRGFTGPRFFGNCGQGRPGLLSVEQGTSIGYTDRYPAHFHGQNVDLTGVPAGIYVLVHRANANGRLRESRTENNAASVRLRIARPNGRRGVPTVRVLRVCEARERC